jgi:flagellar assembly protein FliH
MPELAKEYLFEQLEPSAPPDPDEAERLIARAHTEAQRIREQARSEGFEQGYASGREQANVALSSASAAVAAAAQGITALHEQASEALERDAVELALALGVKVVAGALDAQPERVLDVVRGALRRVADRRTITILVDPVDMEIVSAAVEDLRATTGGVERCEVHADRRVGPGGAIVRTDEGEVDACVRTQLERAREVIAAELGAGSLAPSEPPRG